jgi:acetyltransferase-like isoleucine patch superfamily enzyme
LPWDWYEGSVPENVVLPEDAYAETTYSFLLFRSHRPGGVSYERGAATYLGTMFDVGPEGRVRLGECVLCHGAWFICDREIRIGAYSMISWNVVFMDTYRVPLDPAARRRVLEELPFRSVRRPDDGGFAAPISVGRNVWIGFNACVLPGVTIGEGSIVGAHSVVNDDVPPFSVVAGNPARSIRRLDPGNPPPCS